MPTSTSIRKQLCAALLTIGALGLGSNSAFAEKIVVSNYGTSTNGMPFAVAMDKGYFKEAGIDVDGILSSDGGGSTIRNLLGGKLSYGEAALSSVVAAVEGGADLRIISGNVHTVAEFVWVTMADSPIKTFNDLKGKRIGFTNPSSTSQALNYLLLEANHMAKDDVTMIRTGGFGAGLTVLELGGVDAVPITEPLWSAAPAGKYRIIASATSMLPPLSNVVGVTTGEAVRTRGDFIRGVIQVRRKAVEYMYAHPKESADIIAKAYNLEPAVSEKVVEGLLASEKVTKVPYWGAGDFRFDTMDNMIRAQTMVGALKGTVKYRSIVDTSFLPDDLKPAAAK